LDGAAIAASNNTPLSLKKIIKKLQPPTF